MTQVERTWGEWAHSVAQDAGAAAGSALEDAGKAVRDGAEHALDATGVTTAVDYWSSHAPDEVTEEFRRAADEWARDRLGTFVGRVARVGVTPFTAAARFSVQGAQGFDALARRTNAIATGRAAMPAPGEMIAGTISGVVTYAGRSVDTGVKAAAAGGTALIHGDVEGFAAAAEEGLKAAFDIGAIVASGQGVISGARNALGGAGAVVTAGEGAVVATALSRAHLGAAANGLGSAGALEALAQAPVERRGRRRASAKARPPRHREGLTEMPKRPTPGAKPRGQPTKIKAKAEADERRSIRRENEAAQELAEWGFDVEQQPTVAGSKKPDLRLNGNIFDVYSPAYDTPLKNIRGAIMKKVDDNQARRIVVNLDDAHVTPQKLSQHLDRNRSVLDGLVEVITIRRGRIRRIYPRGE